MQDVQQPIRIGAGIAVFSVRFFSCYRTPVRFFFFLGSRACACAAMQRIAFVCLVKHYFAFYLNANSLSIFVLSTPKKQKMRNYLRMSAFCCIFAPWMICIYGKSDSVTCR